MKSHAEVCPVCKGSGKYRDYTNCNYTATIYVEKTCHGCSGTGWVSVIDDYTPDWGNPPKGTVVFSDNETDMNNYFKEFCENRGIKQMEFCDEGNHIPYID